MAHSELKETAEALTVKCVWCDSSGVIELKGPHIGRPKGWAYVWGYHICSQCVRKFFADIGW